jgi:hypothetical protein
MRPAIPLHWIDSGALLRLREASRRALPYLLLGIAMVGYVLIAISQGWL